MKASKVFELAAENALCYGDWWRDTRELGNTMNPYIDMYFGEYPNGLSMLMMGDTGHEENKIECLGLLLMAEIAKDTLDKGLPL